jgi:hypothetical protein
MQKVIDANAIQFADDLLKSEKPKIIAQIFREKEELTEEQIAHFETAPYMWQMTPIKDGEVHAGMHMGLLMDDSLEYIHIVISTFEMVGYFTNLHENRNKR